MNNRFKNTVEDAFAYAMMAVQLNTTKGTVFGAYNAVTRLLSECTQLQGTMRKQKLQSIVMGGTAQAKTQRAF